MSTWYKVNRYSSTPQISTVEVVKESPEFVTFLEKSWSGRKQERRQRKGGEFFPNFNAAKLYMIKTTEQSIQWNRDEYSRLVSKLKAINELQENS